MMKKSILLIVISIFPLVSCQKKEIQCQSFEVTKRNLSKNVEANGSIETKDTVEVYAPVSGRLEHVYIKEGDMVRARQKIASMSSDARSVILDMAASKNKEDANYWEKQILLTPIFSPVAGKIITLKNGIGDKINGSVAQISTGEIIRADVDEADLPDIKLNQDVQIHFDINSKATLIGKLEKIAQISKLVNNVNVYQVEVSLPSDEQRKKIPFEIKIGMSVTLYFSVNEKKDATALPMNAVAGKSLATVSLLKEDNTTVKVKLGDAYGDWVEVLSGLVPGDKIKIPVFKAQQGKVRKSPLMIKKD